MVSKKKAATGRRNAKTRPKRSRNKSSFGRVLRNLRESEGVGLRELSEVVGMSPAYLSMVERDELAPPAQDKVLAIAIALDQDRDVFFALAGRVAPDLPNIIMKHPREMATLVRATRGLSLDKIASLTRQAKKLRR